MSFSLQLSLPPLPLTVCTATALLDVGAQVAVVGWAAGAGGRRRSQQAATLLRWTRLLAATLPPQRMFLSTLLKRNWGDT